MKHFVSTCVFALSLAACGENTPDAAREVSAGGSVAGCTTRAYEEIGGPFSLIDQNGETRTEADFEGSPALVFFGFTYCPDVCPITLVKIDRALDQVEESKRPVPILISVDPERDTPEALSRYLSLDAYPDNTVGLTGTPSAIKAAADEFIASYSKIPLPDSEAEYTMDHTSLIYLMDENWQLKTFFSYDSSDADIASCLKELL